MSEAEAKGAIAAGAVGVGRVKRIGRARPSGSLAHVLSLDDLEIRARKHLPRPIFGFVAGGAETNSSLQASRSAFANYRLVPRVLVDTTGRSLATDLLGRRYAAPFGIPPMGASALAAYRGDIVLARAAAALDIPFILSASSLIRMEDVAPANRAGWFQAYLPGEPPRIEALVDRVAAAGFGTFVLTVDLPVGGNRENNVRNGFSMPLRPTPRLAWDGITRPRWLLGTAARTLMRHGMPHFENADATRGPPILSRDLERAVGRREGLSWEHVALIRRRWQGHFVLKGILSPEDARIARESGVDAIVVSNHGGRQLDSTIAPLHALPAIAEAARGIAIILDGGIRRGTDVLKALALGAHFVFVGRPFLYAASLAGEAGVRHAAAILSAEIDRDMVLLGINRPSEMNPALLSVAPN